MSATTIANALKTVLLATPELDTVLTYRPATIQTSPMVYIQYQRRERRSKFARVWHFRIRLCVIFQDNEGAESAYLALLGVIPNAIEAAPTLSLASHLASVTNGDDRGTLSMDGVVCRVCDYVAEVMDKSAA